MCPGSPTQRPTNTSRPTNLHKPPSPAYDPQTPHASLAWPAGSDAWRRCTSGLYGRDLLRGRASLVRCLSCSGGFRPGKELRGYHRLGRARLCATLAGWGRTPAGDREGRARELVGSLVPQLGAGPAGLLGCPRVTLLGRAWRSDAASAGAPGLSGCPVSPSRHPEPHIPGVREEDPPSL